MSQTNTTTDHDVIRRWTEARKGHPSVVKGTEGRRGSAGLLRIDFDPPEDSLEQIDWDEFFDTFDRNNLAFLYQERTASGRRSRFNKFVSRDTADEQGSRDRDEDDEEDER
jgi:hypothetical protein